MKIKYRVRCVKVKYGDTIEVPVSAKALTLRIASERYAEVAWLEGTDEK